MIAKYLDIAFLGLIMLVYIPITIMVVIIVLPFYLIGKVCEKYLSVNIESWYDSST